MVKSEWWSRSGEVRVMELVCWSRCVGVGEVESERWSLGLSESKVRLAMKLKSYLVTCDS